MWPFRKREKSAPASYTEQAIEAGIQAATNPVRKEICGHIQAAANAWSEALALCEVQASPAVQRVLSSRLMAAIGYELVIHGAAFRRITVMGGRLELQRPLRVTRNLRYWNVEIGEPGASRIIAMLDDESLYLPWHERPDNPYVPEPPWRTVTGSLSQEIDVALKAEAGGPLGHVLFIQNPGPYSDHEASKNTVKAVKPQIDFTGTNRGSLATLSNPNQAQGRGFSADAQGKPFRIGAAWPTSLAEVRNQLGPEILSSCSVPPALLMGGAPGPAQITARRHFVSTAVPSRCKVLAELLSEAFGERIEIDHGPTRRADISTAARAAKNLVEIGVDLDRALELAGLQ